MLYSFLIILAELMFFKILMFLFAIVSLYSEDRLVETQHEIKIDGKPFKYKALAGTLTLKDAQNKDKASIFYVAYVKDDLFDPVNRPIAFCFNGGPGSCSIWLHMGLLGPKKLALDEEGRALPPYITQPNPETLLATTDLVFIDPISTGFSEAAPGEDPKQFWGVNEDIKSIAEFIRLYISKNKRWASPKFVMGESYGAIRAVGLLEELYKENNIHLNGVILISSVLNFQTIRTHPGNDLAHVLLLPSFTATAWYHGKLSNDLLNRDLIDVLEEVEDFAMNDYSLALFKGDRLPKEEKERIIKQLSKYTGISSAYIQQSNLRLTTPRFSKELLRDKQKIVGRFDGRVEGMSCEPFAPEMEYDASDNVLLGGATASFNDYLQRDLKWEQEKEYKIHGNVMPWNFGERGANRYINMVPSLASSLAKQPNVHLFIASGYYDLATPYYAIDYTLNHLGLDEERQARISLHFYQGGHKIYVNPLNLTKLTQDLSEFIISSCPYVEEQKGEL